MDNARLHLLTERLSSLVRAEQRLVATRHGLKLVQLEALVYLAVANRYSDTSVALAEYFGVTKGTVSQTLKTLEHRGLIEKRNDVDDRRVQHCALTSTGRAIAKDAYPASCFAGVDRHAAGAFADSLERQLRALQQASEFRTFGQCHTCRFFEQRPRGGRCGITGETLTKLDTTKICREHAHP